MLGNDTAKGIIGAGLTAGYKAEVAGRTGAGPVLDCNSKAFLGKILGCAGMVGHGGDGSTVLQAQLAVLGVAAGQVCGIIKNVSHEIIYIGLGYIIAGKNNRADRNGSSIRMLKISGFTVILAAAGKQAQGHDKSQNQCKKSFHHYSPFSICILIFRSIGLLYCYCSALRPILQDVLLLFLLLSSFIDNRLFYILIKIIQFLN